LSLSISLYRSIESGDFSNLELDGASTLLPRLAIGVDLHGKARADRHSVATIAEAECALHCSFPGLSERECEVAARAKVGMSARRIGADLGIAETTVISHRKSAYARMELKGLRELTNL
jgi:FixJ family two-component response regulator